MTERQVLDLDDLAYLDASKFPVKHPKTGKVVGHITAAGPANSKVIAHNDAVWKEEAEQRAQYQRAVIDATMAGEPLPEDPFRSPNPEAIRDKLARRMAAHVLDADFAVKVGGEVVEFGPDTAYKVFADPHNAWLLAPFREYVDNAANFINGSATA